MDDCLFVSAFNLIFGDYIWFPFHYQVKYTDTIRDISLFLVLFILLTVDILQILRIVTHKILWFIFAFFKCLLLSFKFIFVSLFFRVRRIFLRILIKVFKHLTVITFARIAWYVFSISWRLFLLFLLFWFFECFLIKFPFYDTVFKVLIYFLVWYLLCLLLFNLLRWLLSCP